MRIGDARPLMSLDEMKSRLRERIEMLDARLKSIDREAEPKRYKNTQGEKITAERRLRLLEEKVSTGRQA